jgi:hypothetical protein
VPRAKYIKSPGPLPEVEHIQPSQFRFRDDQWVKLAKLLPHGLASLPAQSEYRKNAAKMPHPPRRMLKTIADVVVYETETVIENYLTAAEQLLSDKMPTVASARAAIQRLRKALEPFTRRWVDTETAELIPEGLDAALEDRERELAGLRPPTTPRRNLIVLCTSIRMVARLHDATISDWDVLKYIDCALTCARINHPDLAKHRDRLTALVFPKIRQPSQLPG